MIESNATAPLCRTATSWWASHEMELALPLPGECWTKYRCPLSVLSTRSRTGATLPSMIRAVVFDVGECLVDETREYGTWADWLGVPRHTFAAMFGAVIAQGRDYRETFQEFRPGFDLTEEREKRAAAGQAGVVRRGGPVPDVRPTLAALREAGLWVGIAGNQTVRAGGLLRGLDLPVRHDRHQ